MVSRENRARGVEEVLDRTENPVTARARKARQKDGQDEKGGEGAKLGRCLNRHGEKPVTARAREARTATAAPIGD